MFHGCINLFRLNSEAQKLYIDRSEVTTAGTEIVNVCSPMQNEMLFDSHVLPCIIVINSPMVMGLKSHQCKTKKLTLPKFYNIHNLTQHKEFD